MFVKFLYILFIPFMLIAQSNNIVLYEFLKEQFKDYHSFNFELINKIGSEQIRINNNLAFKINGNTASVPVIVLENGKEKKSTLLVRIQLFDSVLAASNDLVKKKNLSEYDFHYKIAELTGLSGTPVKNKSFVNSHRLRCVLKKDEILLTEMLEITPIVYPGDMVTAELCKGNVVITFDASVKQEGSYGDKIKIVTEENKLLDARVIDNKNVIIE